jgi:hypothetical protein
MKNLLILALFLLVPVVAFGGQVHVTTCNEGQDCTLVIHAPVLAGTNTAGTTWKAVLIDVTVGTPSTSLSDSIINSATEKADIASGDVIEFSVRRNLIGVSNAGGVAAKKAAMDALVDGIIANKEIILQRTYNWYGYQQPAQ